MRAGAFAHASKNGSAARIVVAVTNAAR